VRPKGGCPLEPRPPEPYPDTLPSHKNERFLRASDRMV
jgi:hypothetical protein